MLVKELQLPLQKPASINNITFSILGSFHFTHWKLPKTSSYMVLEHQKYWALMYQTNTMMAPSHVKAYDNRILKSLRFDALQDWYKIGPHCLGQHETIPLATSYSVSSCSMPYGLLEHESHASHASGQSSRAGPEPEQSDMTLLQFLNWLVYFHMIYHPPLQAWESNSLPAQHIMHLQLRVFWVNLVFSAGTLLPFLLMDHVQSVLASSYPGTVDWKLDRMWDW